MASIKETLEGTLGSVAYKRIKSVETDPASSNQHEFNGVTALRQILGTGSDKKQTFHAKFFYLSDEQTKESELDLTWYDARRTHPTRSEHRLYFRPNSVSELAEQGDLFILARISSENCLGFICRKDSAIENLLMNTLGLDEVSDQFGIGMNPPDLPSYLAPHVLPVFEMLGLPPTIPKAQDRLINDLIGRFGDKFPRQDEFARYAIETGPETDAVHSPDETLMVWWDHQTDLFYALEDHLEWPKISEGFDSVEHFAEEANSFLNRRKARVGTGFEYLFRELLTANGIAHSFQEITEGNSKSDFIFPGIDRYEDPGFPHDRLTMCGAKTTIRGNWPMLLGEAKRIAAKHLVTIDGQITESLGATLKSEGIQLVIPRPMRALLPPTLRNSVPHIDEFLNMLKDRAG